MAHTMRRVGTALILLAKAQPSSASAMGRPNWARLYSTSLRVRGGAEAVGGPDNNSATSSDTSHPFRHLPGIEVGDCHARYSLGLLRTSTLSVQCGCVQA